MRIAFITQPWDGIGPGSSIGIITCNFIAKLSNDHQIRVYAKNGKCEFPESENVTYKHISLKFDSYILKLQKVIKKLKIIGSKNKPFFSRNIYFIIFAVKVARDIKKHKMEIVHIHNYSQFVNIIRFFNPKAKIFLHMHCEWLTQLDNKMISNRLSKTDCILSVSNYLSDKIKHRYKEYVDRCLTLENGFDENIFEPNDNNFSAGLKNEIRLLFVGRVSPEKGVHTLCGAFNILCEKYKNIIVDVVGPIKSIPFNLVVGISDDEKVQQLSEFYSGKDYPSQLKDILSKEASEKIVFHGQKNATELSDYYKNADIVINASFSEAFGMSLIEAMASEVPVVASRIGGMVEIIEQSNAGLLFEVGNVDDLADCLDSLINDGKKRKSLRENGREFSIENYSWDSIINKLESYYNDV